MAGRTNTHDLLAFPLAVTLRAGQVICKRPRRIGEAGGATGLDRGAAIGEGGVAQPEGPAMADLTPHQQKIVKRYYDNLGDISRQRLAELVGELYLATGKKRARVWESIVAAMQKL